MWKGRYLKNTYYGIGTHPMINWSEINVCLEEDFGSLIGGVSDDHDDTSDFELLLPLELM